MPDAAAARARLPAPAVGRPAPARAHRDGARLRAGARHRRRADDGARRHDPGADPRSAARRCSSGSGSRCCSSRTTSASSPRWPTASPSCTRGGSSKQAPVRDALRAIRSIPYTRGLLASMPGGAPGARLRAIEGTVPPLGAAAARLRVRRRAARIDSSRAPTAPPRDTTDRSATAQAGRSATCTARRSSPTSCDAAEIRHADAARSKSRTSSRSSRASAGCFGAARVVARRGRRQLRDRRG